MHEPMRNTLNASVRIVATAVLCGCLGPMAQAQSLEAPPLALLPQDARTSGDVSVVPVEVTDASPTNAGLAVTLVNRSSQVIAAYSVGATQSGEADPRHFEAMWTTTGTQWHPAAEQSIVLAIRPADASTRVVVRAVVMTDGRGYGDRTFIERTVQEWNRQRSGVSDVLGLLDAADVPADDEALQALVDRIALRVARVPGGPGAETRLAPYMSTIAGLKRLQGRELGGTDRMASEMAHVKDDLRRQLDAVPGLPARSAR
jgi:hypothetical protein